MSCFVACQDESPTSAPPSIALTGELTLDAAYLEQTAVEVELEPGVGAQALEGGVLVSFDWTFANEDLARASQLAGVHGARIVGQSASLRVAVLQVEPERRDDLIADLLSIDAVVFAGPDLVMEPDLLPDPPPGDWGPPPRPSVGGWWVRRINAEPAWDTTVGSGDVTIGVVDFTLSASVATDLTGRVTYAPGISQSNDGNRHGMAVATLAAGDGADAAGLAGVCWRCGIRFSSFRSTGGVLAGIEGAVRAGNQVVNVSAGPAPPVQYRGAARCQEPEAARQRRRIHWRGGLTPGLRLASDRGTLVVMSAGNDCFARDDRLLPARSAAFEKYWQHAGLIVGATDVGRGIPDFSRRGEVVQIWAPGDQLTVFDAAGSEILDSGTSYASPLVAGAAGLIKSVAPDLLPSEVKEILLDGAHPLAATPTTSGELNVLAAVQSARVRNEANLKDELQVELLPGEELMQTITVDLPAEGLINSLDVLFLIDVSGSFNDDIESLKASAFQIMMDLRSLAPNAAFGVAAFSDFPEGRFGDPGDLPFRLDQPITTDVAAVQTAIDNLNRPLLSGGDGPESQLQALLQAAEDPSVSFRTGALPLVILATDAPFHDSAVNPGYPGPTRDQTVDALNRRGITVIGLDSGNTLGHLQDIVDATGGQLFQLRSDSSGIGQAIFDGVQMALETLTISLRPSGDLEGFVRSITPMTIPDARRGQRHEFDVLLRSDLPGAREALTFAFFLGIRAEGVAIVERIPIRVTIPPRP